MLVAWVRLIALCIIISYRIDTRNFLAECTVLVKLPRDQQN